MAVLVFQVYFYTVLVIEKKTKFSSMSPRKYAILTPKSQKNFLARGTPSPYTPPPLAPLVPRLGSRLRRSTLTPQLQLLDPPASYCTTEGSVFQSGHQFTTARDRQTTVTLVG